MPELDLGGGGEYKRTYGPSEVRVPGFRASRYRALPALRAAARFATVQRQALRGRLPRKT